MKPEQKSAEEKVRIIFESTLIEISQIAKGLPTILTSQCRIIAEHQRDICL